MYDKLVKGVKGVKEVYKINLGIDTDDRLLRAQGALYMYMRKNKALTELLLSEYKKRKEFLPFVILD